MMFDIIEIMTGIVPFIKVFQLVPSFVVGFFEFCLF